MAGKLAASEASSSFDFELVGDDYDQPTTVITSSNQISPWIDPSQIKLRHRIGRGPFGDVWLATRHQATEEYEEFHEVAIKMLHPIKEDAVNDVLSRLDYFFSKCQELESVCRMQGVTMISGKLCIVMKFYEGSIGDKMCRRKGGKLSLHDVLRYGTGLAQGLMELHSKEILILNLKPYNILLDENNHAIIGEIGIPYVLLGIPLLSVEMTQRLGTPNYMAPEQWQPEVRGPISFETDSWGFACSIVEMLTGVQPWSGRSVDEIYRSVVRRQEKPHLLAGLPPAVENIISGCFEYDLRSRPLMEDILYAFKSSQNAVLRDGSWKDPGRTKLTEKSSFNGYSKWFLLKDHLQVGDMVRSRKPPNSCKPETMEVPEGCIVGLDRDSDQNGYVLVRVHGIHGPLRVNASTLERVTYGFAAGDWVRLKADGMNHSPVGILHVVNRDGSVAAGFIGLQTLWRGRYSELQMAESYCVGQFVQLKSDTLSPRFAWPRKRGGEWATGRICQVLPNGCLVVKFPGKLTFGDENSSFLADPAEVETVSFTTSPGVVKKYLHLEDFHWAIRPLVIALGLFTAMKLGLLVGKRIGCRSKIRKERNHVTPVEAQPLEGHTSGDAGWLPPQVANIIFREGVSTPAS